MKKLFDIIFSFTALLALSPLLIVVSILIKKDGGPIIYFQERVGLEGLSFKIFKFRSMVVNADKIGSYQTKDNDDRITKVGKFIRKTSIDELPQFVNVLLGDMSIVGPRPNVPKQRDEYTEADWNKRNTVQPGITGLAQATYRSSATFDQRLEMDMNYAKKASFVFDLKIILMTIKQVLLKGGN